MLKLNNKLEYIYKQGLFNFRQGALRGCPPLEGVADKQQSGEKRPCLQGRFVERLAWERGEDLPLLYDKIPPAKSLLKNQMHVTLLLYSHNCKKVWRACFASKSALEKVFKYTGFYKPLFEEIARL